MFYFRSLILITCSVFTSIFCEKIDVKCDETNYSTCSMFNFNSTDKELDFLTNTTQSIRDSITVISFKGSWLGRIPSKVFTAYRNLKALGLSQCKITLIDENTLEDASTAFNGGENLEILNLSYNYIEHIPLRLFNKLTKLTHLTFYDNKIKSLDDATFSSLTNLVWLSLQYNELTVISPNVFSQNNEISFLDVSNNQLTDVEDAIKNLKKLETLKLNRNRITKLVNYPQSVQSISIVRNQVTKLFININVVELVANNNKISEIFGNENSKLVEMYVDIDTNLMNVTNVYDKTNVV